MRMNKRTTMIGVKSEEDQESTTIRNDGILYPDSEPEVSSNLVPKRSSGDGCQSEVVSSAISPQAFEAFESIGMVKMEEGSCCYQDVKKRFLDGINGGALLGNNKQVFVVAIHKNNFSGLSGQARFQAFKIFATATLNLRGDAKLRFGWYGARREEISQIFSHGFDTSRHARNGIYQFYGSGIYLATSDCSVDGVFSSPTDENGLRHVLLCKVILGKQEVIEPGSKQVCPSSKEFDSGVDSLTNPRRYIVWHPYVNSHILPYCVVSFRTQQPPSTGGIQTRVAQPTSPWMRFDPIMAALWKHIPAPIMQLLEKHHKAYQERKMSREEMIFKLRQVAGDGLLIDVIRHCSEKKRQAVTNLEAATRSNRLQGSLVRKGLMMTTIVSTANVNDALRDCSSS